MKENPDDEGIHILSSPDSDTERDLEELSRRPHLPDEPFPWKAFAGIMVVILILMGFTTLFVEWVRWLF